MIPATEQPGYATRGRLLLGWVRWFLLIAGALAVCYVAVTLLHARFYQEAANNTLQQQMQSREQHKANPPAVVAKEGDLLGHIEIPRLGLKVAILEGTRSRTLRLGVGHINGTALPGQPGNIGIAGHRDTFFRGLKDIRPSDEIQIQTATGLSDYEVDWVKIVPPDDTAVLAPSAESGLTLVTCYPFYFIGAAPQRFVVHARKKQSDLQKPALYHSSTGLADARGVKL
jgi:sortase A